MSKSLFLAAALGGGLVLPVQVAINALLRKHVGQPMQVTFVSYAVGALASLALCLAARYPLPSATALQATTWWMWLGGCLGTFYVWSTIFATPQIGAALALALTVAGQMLAAALLDHYGLLGLTKLPLSPLRLLGLALVVGGVALIAVSKK